MWYVYDYSSNSTFVITSCFVDIAAAVTSYYLCLLVKLSH